MLKVLQIAQSEVGYHEQGDNFTKFAEELDRIRYFNTSKQNLAWCAVFVCWCFVKAYGADGEFGAATDKALRKFQTAYYLAVDGEAGHDTWSALLGVSK